MSLIKLSKKEQIGLWAQTVKVEFND